MFGVFEPKQKTEKLDIATGGEDIEDLSPLETEEKAEKKNMEEVD